jgi:hypothetical protein
MPVLYSRRGHLLAGVRCQEKHPIIQAIIQGLTGVSARSVSRIPASLITRTSSW